MGAPAMVSRQHHEHVGNFRRPAPVGPVFISRPDGNGLRGHSLPASNDTADWARDSATCRNPHRPPAGAPGKAVDTKLPETSLGRGNAQTGGGSTKTVC